MALLDTTVFVDLQGRGGRARQMEAEEILRELLSNGEALVTSRINVAELYVGVELSKGPEVESKAIADFLEWVAVVELNDACARSFARVRADLQRRGRLVGDMDMLIGEIALANGHAVVTRNAGHFGEMQGLRVIGYGKRKD